MEVDTPAADAGTAPASDGGTGPVMIPDVPILSEEPHDQSDTHALPLPASDEEVLLAQASEGRCVRKLREMVFSKFGIVWKQMMSDSFMFGDWSCTPAFGSP